MKCPKCNGSGDIPRPNGTKLFGLTEVMTCDMCHGSGEVDMTNEEFLRSTTTEELAGAIYEWFTLGFTRGKNGKKLNPITEVVEWLKEIHE